jgi:hypothetical protein
LYGFIPNKSAERVVASVVLRSKDILNHLVKLFPGGEDVAQVISVNHFPSVYTILAPGEEYAQCNCPWADQGHICKHSVKVYKMIHPDVEDSNIIRLRGSLRGTIAVGIDNASLDSFRSPHLLAPPALGKGRAGNQKGTKDTIQSLRDIHREMEQLAEGSESVLDCALFHARSSRGKVLDYIASVQGKTNHPLSQIVFRSSDGDNSLKRRKSFLER